MYFLLGIITCGMRCAVFLCGVCHDVRDFALYRSNPCGFLRMSGFTSASSLSQLMFVLVSFASVSSVSVVCPDPLVFWIVSFCVGLFCWIVWLIFSWSGLFGLSNSACVCCRSLRIDCWIWLIVSCGSCSSCLHWVVCWFRFGCCRSSL